MTNMRYICDKKTLMMRLFEIIAIGVYAQIMRLHVIDRPDFAIMQIIGKFRNSLFNFTK